MREAIFSLLLRNSEEGSLRILTQRAPKGRRRIQPAEREPRRRPKGDILHAQREAMRIFVLYCFGGMLETLIFHTLFKVLGVLRFSW